jgi:delta 1-pyrroline-5-carboxylate dehydrogenase
VLSAHKGRAQTAPDLIANSIAPAAFEVSSLAEVKDEILGPVLQIVRWGSGAGGNAVLLAG